MLEFLNSLTMEAVIAILGTVVSITLGIFGYLLKIKPNSDKAGVDALKDTLHEHTQQIEKLHTRVSNAKEIALENKGEIRAIMNLVKTMEKQLAGHEQRDIEDFKVMQQKIDKIMDIVIQILQDDRL